MRTRTVPWVLVGLIAVALAGCGVARQLTTRTRTYAYTTSLPAVPVNSVQHAEYAIDEEVRNTYHRYHGGVDWTRVSYSVQNSSTSQPVTLKLYASTVADVPASELETQSTLVETITLAPGETRAITPAQAAKNDVLRRFLASALSQRDVAAVHFYGASTSADPAAMVTVTDLTTRVQVHGSYF